MLKRSRMLLSLILALAMFAAYGNMFINAEGIKPVVNVEIKYVKNDADRTVVAQSYKATVPLGFSENETVSTPKIGGYTAKSVDPASEGISLSPDGSKYTVNFSKFTRDTVLSILYEPNTVNYSVKHLLQDIDLKNYTEKSDLTEQLSAKVGEMVSASAKEVEGFTVEKPLQSEKIPAEGELELQVRYKRNSYSITYNTDGGSYVPTEKRLFEEALTQPSDPKKEGYTFGCWTDETTGKDFAFTPGIKMPATDIKLKAKWIPGEGTAYRLAYYVQNADDDNYKLLAYVPKVGKTGETVSIPANGGDPKTGFDAGLIFPGLEVPDTWNDYPKDHMMKRYFDRAYKFNADKTADENNGNKISPDGKTIVPIYFDRRVISLTVGGWPEDYKEGSTEWVPEFTHKGKKYDRNNPYKFNIRFGQDIDEFLPSASEITNNDNPKGAVIEDYFVLGDYDAGDWSWLGTKKPYVFDKNYIWVKPYEFDQAEPMKISYWLTMDIQNAPNIQRVDEYFQDIKGNYHTDPSAAEYSEYHAYKEIPLADENWFYDARSFAGFSADETRMLTYQKYDRKRKSYKEISKNFIIQRDKDSKPTLGIRDKYLYDEDGDGKYEKEEIENKGYTRGVDGSVKAYYKRNKYDLKFHFDPTGEAEKTVSVFYEAKIGAMLPGEDEIRAKKPKTLPEDYEFKGWYTNLSYAENDKVTANRTETMPAATLDLYAKWGAPDKSVKVVMDPDNGEAESKIELPYGSKLADASPQNPSKAGFKFLGWKLEGSEAFYDFMQPIIKDISLKAAYEAGKFSDLTIKYQDMDGNDLIEAKTVKDLEVGRSHSFEAPDIEGMWPDYISKSIEIAADSSKNVLIFKYKPFTSAVYRVRYISRKMDASGNIAEKDIHKADSVTTDKSIDTRNYIDIKGFSPITLQQTIRLAWAAENVMTFVYKPDAPGSSEYRIEYYFEKEAGKFEQDKSKTIELSGAAGEKIKLGPSQLPDIPGYVIDSEKSVLEGTITSKPVMVLKVYYKKVKPSETPGENGMTKKSPQTGENYNGVLPLILLSAAGLLLITLLVKKSGKNR